MKEKPRIFLLGDFSIEAAHEKSQGLIKKTRALLGYLCVERGQNTRQQLVQLFFADAEDPSGALRWHLSKIRQCLGKDLLQSQGDRVYLEHEQLFIDLFVLSDILQKETQGHQPIGVLESAHRLYRGDLMSGFDGVGTSDLDLWLLNERTKAQRLQKKLLKKLISIFLQEGDVLKACDYTSQLVKLDPYQEKFHRLLLQLYVLTGQKSAALQHYDLYQKKLHKEFGVPLSPELNAMLLEAIHSTDQIIGEIDIPTWSAQKYPDPPPPLHATPPTLAISDSRADLPRSAREQENKQTDASKNPAEQISEIPILSVDVPSEEYDSASFLLAEQKDFSSSSFDARLSFSLEHPCALALPASRLAVCQTLVSCFAQGKSALIQGCAGSGKTYLLQTLRDMASPSMCVLFASCSTVSQTDSYGILRILLERLLSQTTPSQKANFPTALRSNLLKHFPLLQAFWEPMDADLFPSSLSIEQIFLDTFRYCVRFYPIVFLLDDIHQIDEKSRQIFQQLRSYAEQERIAFSGTISSEFLLLHPEAQTIWRTFGELHLLPPLSRKEWGELFGKLAPSTERATQDTLLFSLYEIAQGMPWLLGVFRGLFVPCALSDLEHPALLKAVSLKHLRWLDTTHLTLFRVLAFLSAPCHLEDLEQILQASLETFYVGIDIGLLWGWIHEDSDKGFSMVPFWKNVLRHDTPRAHAYLLQKKSQPFLARSTQQE